MRLIVFVLEEWADRIREKEKKKGQKKRQRIETNEEAT